MMMWFCFCSLFVLAFFDDDDVVFVVLIDIIVIIAVVVVAPSLFLFSQNSIPKKFLIYI